MLRVVLVEDQTLFRSSLAMLLQSKLGASITGEFATGEELIAAVPSLGKVDLILLDIQLPGEDGITMAGRFAELLPDARIVLLSSIRQNYLLQKALQCGAHGYVHKDDSADSLLTAIQTVTAGGCYFGYTIQQLRREMGMNPDCFSKLLSPKEQEVLELLGQGLTNEDAAPMLALRPETVQTHRRNIMRKLGLHNATQVQAYALKNGFTSISDLR